MKNIHGSGNTTLTNSKKKINDIIKIVQYLDEPGLLIKRPSGTIKNEAREHKGGFIIMLLGILVASLLGSL